MKGSNTAPCVSIKECLTQQIHKTYWAMQCNSHTAKKRLRSNNVEPSPQSITFVINTRVNTRQKWWGCWSQAAGVPAEWMSMKMGWCDWLSYIIWIHSDWVSDSEQGKLISLHQGSDFNSSWCFFGNWHTEGKIQLVWLSYQQLSIKKKKCFNCAEWGRKKTLLWQAHICRWKHNKMLPEHTNKAFLENNYKATTTRVILVNHIWVVLSLVWFVHSLWIFSQASASDI